MAQYQQAFNQFQCQQIIMDALDEMIYSGYDFLYRSAYEFKGKAKVKQMKRNSIYLRFNCLRCPNQGKKRFTSTMGTIGIKFQLHQPKQGSFDPWLLDFNMKIYRMKCQYCFKYGKAQIYDSQLGKIQTQFCKILAQIMDKEPPKQRQRRKENIPKLIDHRHDLCQACQLGKCHDKSCQYYSSKIVQDQIPNNIPDNTNRNPRNPTNRLNPPNLRNHSNHQSSLNPMNPINPNNSWNTRNQSQSRNFRNPQN